MGSADPPHWVEGPLSGWDISTTGRFEIGVFDGQRLIASRLFDEARDAAEFIEVVELAGYRTEAIHTDERDAPDT